MTESQLPQMRIGASGWDNRAGVPLYGNGTSFQAVGGNAAGNNFDSKRRVASAHKRSRVRPPRAASRASPGALWSVSDRKPLQRNLKNSRCPPSPALPSGSVSRSAARPSGNLPLRHRPFNRRDRVRVALFAAPRTRASASYL